MIVLLIFLMGVKITQTSWIKRNIRIFINKLMLPNNRWFSKMLQRAHSVDPNNPNTDLAQMYTDWNNRVILTVPAEKLLIFNVKEGWKPLCDFLGFRFPDKPFPG